MPAHNTSRTCFACGAVDSRSRKNQASFVCTTCGHRDHADINAAKVILRRNTASMRVEERHWPSGEARTIGGATRLGRPLARASLGEGLSGPALSIAGGSAVPP
ncbi:MAG: zinc ribbon domain-containing protein [Alphaproteobacteria bacterium]|nr:zinc ribbon domain-containing protein [Alphaproteobacteria bacterium]